MLTTLNAKTRNTVTVPSIAMDSLFEFQTQLQIEMDINVLNDQLFSELFELSRELEHMLSSFIRNKQIEK